MNDLTLDIVQLRGVHRGQLLDELLTSAPVSCGDQKGH